MTRAPARSAPEHEKARWWRESKMGLTRDALAPLLGLTVSAIADYETGKQRSTGQKISDKAWRRYRLACAALDTRKGDWNWSL